MMTTNLLRITSTHKILRINPSVPNDILTTIGLQKICCYFLCAHNMSVMLLILGIFVWQILKTSIRGRNQKCIFSFLQAIQLKLELRSAAK